MSTKKFNDSGKIYRFKVMQFDVWEQWGVPRLRARGTDSHASDVGHWLGMTPLARCAGRCTPRVLASLRGHRPLRTSNEGAFV